MSLRLSKLSFAILVALTSIAACAVSKTDYSHYVSVKPSSSTSTALGSSTYSDFPVLVRLPSSASALLQSADGTDLLVLDENETPLSFEVETFDPSGTTFVWVKVPTLSANTALTVYLGGSANSDNNSTAVWSKYVGVWHFSPSEAGGTTVADATGHDLGGTTTGTITTYTGPFGGDALKSTVKVQAPDYDSRLSNVAQFSVSGWFKAPSFAGTSGKYHAFVSKKDNLTWNVDKGWYIEMAESKTKANLVLTGSNNFTIPDVTANWNYFYLVSDGSTVKVYMNGSASAAKSVSYKVKASAKSLTICGANGCSDEYRIRAGAVTATEAALEYATMANAEFFDYGTVTSTDATAPTVGVPVVTRDASGAFLVSAEVSENVPASVAYDADGVSDAMATSDAELPMTYSATITGLVSDKTYLCSVKATSTGGTVTEKPGTTAFYNGNLSVVKISDADEDGFVPGVFRISRADTAHDLAVAYTVGGTATAGQTYSELSGIATIPAGYSSVDIEVVPLLDKKTLEDTTVVLSLSAGLYGVDVNAGEATMIVANIVAPAGFNTWISPSNSLASIGCNWSEGHSPTELEHVLFDGRFSTANCTWDASASATVASWAQTNDYTGVITLKTVFPGKGDFQCLTITGDMTIDSGTITHPLSLNSTSKTWLTGTQIREQEVYRLCLAVGGTLTVGASGAIDVKDKGHYQALQSNCYGAHAVGYSALGGAAAYGNPKEPIDIGMGCNGNQWAWVSYPGSGAIRITAENVVVNGSICASAGSLAYGSHRRFTAAAGSIWIDADSITGSGSITAVAVQSYDVNNSGKNGRGSGGSIALWTKAPVALGTPFVSAGATASGLNAPGTVYLHDQNMDKGVLIIDGMRSGNPLDYRACVYVTTDGDWTFDEVRLQNYGALSVPVGTTLALPGGWASITSTNAVSAANYGVLRYEGGTISAGTAANVVLNGRWMLTPWSNLVMNANVTVKGGAAIGVPAMADILDNDANGETLPTFVSCNLTVNGNLTVESDGYLLAKRCGLKKYGNSINSGFRGVLPGHTHGGRCRFFKSLDAQGRYYMAYDSVFAPCLPGNSVPYPNGQSAEASGGVLSFVVTGALTLDGEANANGMLETYAAGGNCSGGTGGAIDITAGTLSGSGRILAEGGTKQAQRGSGGRIAVKLTGAGADFSNFTGTISASGRVLSPGGSADSSAGTVYLQTAADGEKGGTVYIAMSAGNRSATNTNTTEMVSLGYGGDDVKDYKKVNYVVSDYGRAAVNTNIVAASVKIADTHSFLDLEGNTLRIKSFMYPKVVNEETVMATLVSGKYTAAELVERGIECVLDSSDEKTGVLNIGGIGFMLFVR